MVREVHTLSCHVCCVDVGTVMMRVAVYCAQEPGGWGAYSKQPCHSVVLLQDTGVFRYSLSRISFHLLFNFSIKSPCFYHLTTSLAFNKTVAILGQNHEAVIVLVFCPFFFSLSKHLSVLYQSGGGKS